MPGKRRHQKEQTRMRIIAAVIKVYTEQGFSAPTTAIAGEAGISHGSIFVHFPSPSLNHLSRQQFIKCITAL
jgi:AcrR family transcriptional regulator